MDCVRSATDILAALPIIFLPCAKCSMQVLDKRIPLKNPVIAEPCSCGKRFIDDVFAHMYLIMREEGDLKSTDPLITVGAPLIHPGFAMDKPPFLPEKSLVLMSGRVSKGAALGSYAEVPEVRGVVKIAPFIPGVATVDPDAVPSVYEVLAGCDVRADIFPLATGPTGHLQTTITNSCRVSPWRIPEDPVCNTACGESSGTVFCGCLLWSRDAWPYCRMYGIPHVILNDAWYASAFWSAFNLEVNREDPNIEQVRLFEQIEDMARHPVTQEPVKIAETRGKQVIEVYQGDFRLLDRVIPHGAKPVTALDIFEKNHPSAVSHIISDWQNRIGGDAFIP